jgi:hypothetical protein
MCALKFTGPAKTVPANTSSDMSKKAIRSGVFFMLSPFEFVD